MYREQYCQRRAIELYALGKTKAEVIQMLKEENAKQAELDSLAERFYRDYEFLRNEKRKKRRKTAERDVLVGSVIIAGGLSLSLLSYLSIGNGRYMLFTGILVTGAVFLVKGMIEKMQLKKETFPQMLPSENNFTQL